MSIVICFAKIKHLLNVEPVMVLICIQAPIFQLPLTINFHYEVDYFRV